MRESVRSDSDCSIVILDKSAPKLRRFSSRIPVPNGEVTFDAYQEAVRSHLEDSDCDDRKLRRAMLDSLNEPASLSIQTVRGKSPLDILHVLASLYGSVEDSEEMLIKFAMRRQGGNEKASDFLKDLYSELTHIASLRRVNVHEFDQLLCKQFNRGCHDETMLLKLRLDDDTLSSIDLITRVRTEEARKLEKRLRLKEESKAARVQQATSSPFESALEKR